MVRTLFLLSSKRAEEAGKPVDIRIALPRAAWVQDLQTGQSLGRLTQLSLTLDPVTPAIVLLSPHELRGIPGGQSPSAPQPTSPPRVIDR